MINIIQHDDEYHITFPYDFKIKELVKQVPGREWHPDKKYWSIPLNHLGMLINVFKGTDFEDMISIRSYENININENLDSTRIIPDIDISQIPLYVKSGGQLYSHQLDFMKFSIDRELHNNMNGFLCCDEMGLGKTIQAINLAIYNKSKYKFKHCLILCCINMSKYNWQQEISTHTNGQFEGYILGSRKKKSGKINYNGSSKNKLDDLKSGHMYGDELEPDLPYFLILNVEAIRMSSNRSHPISDILIEYINSNKLNMIIIDEVHKNVSPTSQQGKQLLRVKRNTGKKCMWIPMTGTPIVNQPTDLFVPLRLVEGHSINSYYAWNKQFCVFGGFGGHEIIGYKHMDQLKSLLQGNMIRRLKSEVLDLPEKIELIEYVENTSYQNKLMKSVEADILSQKDSILKSLNPLAKMLRLRQVNGSPELVDESLVVDSTYLKYNAKLQRLLELIEDILSRREKVVVFSNWVEPLRTIYRHLATKYKVCCFTGTMKEKDRQYHKDLFLSDPNHMIMIGTIGALGTTHTLTAANNIIFYDEPWTAADRQQACDRIHRVGTVKSANIYTLISKDTIDERVHKILYSKEMISNFMVDDKIDIYNNPELFDILMGRN